MGRGRLGVRCFGKRLCSHADRRVNLDHLMRRTLPIHWAARRGDHSAIERQMGRGIAVDAADEDGKTPLMHATEGRLASVDTLRLLVEAGANVNAVSTGLEYTPL